MRLHPPSVQQIENALTSAKTCVSQLQTVLDTVGKPGSGPEFPPEGFHLLRDPAAFGITAFRQDRRVYLAGWAKWFTPTELRDGVDLLRGTKILAIAVPIAPKPEPIKLTDQEKIAGWRGPTGFRLQTFTNRSVQCAICHKPIEAGKRLARWRSRFPESECRDHLVGHPAAEENHSHAHVDCLYAAARDGYPGNYYNTPRSLTYIAADIPGWLHSKRKKFDKQNQ